EAELLFQRGVGLRRLRVAEDGDSGVAGEEVDDHRGGEGDQQQHQHQLAQLAGDEGQTPPTRPSSALLGESRSGFALCGDLLGRAHALKTSFHKKTPMAVGMIPPTSSVRMVEYGWVPVYMNG